MLLTLNASSLRKQLIATGNSKPKLPLTDLPTHAREQLGLHGLNMATDLLVGAGYEDLDRLRDAADKASCPCLVLIESSPQPLAAAKDDLGDAATERMDRVVRAAHRLGCAAVALKVEGKDDDDHFERAAERLKRVLGPAERLEVNLLLMSMTGLTSEPDRLTDLIKKVGGFRIGTFPDFERAASTPDAIHHLRRLTPYASALSASTLAFKEVPGEPGFEHEPYDLGEFTEAISSVGYQGTLAIDYRGKGDPNKGIVQTRILLERALGLEGSK